MTSTSRARPDLLLLAVGVTLVMNLWRVPSLFPIIAPLRPMILGGLFCMAVFVLSRHPARSLALFGTPVTVPLLGLVAVMVASIPTSLDPQLSVVFLFKNALPRLLLALLILGSVRDRRDLEWLILATLAGAWLYTGVMVSQAGSGEGGSDGWGDLLMYDRNDYAMLAVTSLPLAVYFLRRDAGRWRRLFGMATVAMLLYVVARGGSRGGFLGLLAVLGFLALRYRALPARVRLGAVLAGALAIAVVGGTRYRAQLATLLNPTQDYNWSGNDYNGRLELWKRGVGYIADHPVLGVGVSAYTVAEGELSEVARQRQMLGKEVKALHAHNMYIQVAAELGLPGLAVFLFLLWRWYRATRDVRRALEPAAGEPPPPEHALALALTASLLGYLVCGVFLSIAYFAHLFILLGFTAALAKLVPVAARRPAPAPVYTPAWGAPRPGVMLPPAR